MDCPEMNGPCAMTPNRKQTWIVGHDGSDGADHAVDWAIAQAMGREVELTLLRAWQPQALDVPMQNVSVDAFAPKRVCRNIDEITRQASINDTVLTQRIVQGAPSQSLLEASESASMVVLGSRGRGGFRRLLLGSVSSQCATHARVTTVVVPRSATADVPVRRIVVGLDGSERSRLALDWAMDFASPVATILVVGAWMPSRSGYVAVVQHYTNELDEARDRFNEILDGIETDAGRMMFERRFAFADPAATVLEAGDAADLVVVGQRGHSALGAALLGSVSTHVLHRSNVPVAIVPDGD